MFDNFLNADSSAFLLIGALIVGFVVIIWGGDKFVDSSIWIAVKTKMPKMLIGATLVSIGTTLPELFTSYTAAAGGSTAIAIGNSLGSIICNTALILSITLIFASGVVNVKQFLPKVLMLSLSIILTLIFVLAGVVEIWQCFVLLSIGVIYFVYNIIDAIRDSRRPDNVALEDSKIHDLEEDDEYDQYASKKAWVMIILFVVGAACIAVGANLMVASVSGLCAQWGMSESVIALTVVAIGTSLPELVTTITSIKKSSADLSLGNVLGANVMNATFVVGGSGLFAGGLTLESGSYTTTLVSIFLILAVIAVLSLPILIKKRTFRWQGIVCASLYVAYTAFLITQIAVV